MGKYSPELCATLSTLTWWCENWPWQSSVSRSLASACLVRSSASPWFHAEIGRMWYVWVPTALKNIEHIQICYLPKKLAGFRFKTEKIIYIIYIYIKLQKGTHLCNQQPGWCSDYNSGRRFIVAGSVFSCPKALVTSQITNSMPSSWWSCFTCRWFQPGRKKKREIVIPSP